jgi:ABC-type Fe3+-citrate transport system substrate-binding protein
MAFMDAMMTLPELRYLSPTTREKAMIIAQDLIKTSNISPKDAVSKAILIAKNWAVKNVNRSVWKKLKSIDNEAI